MSTLKKQTELEFSYKSFHVDKAIMTLTTENANLLCSNKSTNGWTTVGKYHVRFEHWNSSLHAHQTLILSNGGWLRFRGISMHLWNYNTFISIGKACGGFLAMAREIMEMAREMSSIQPLHLKENGLWKGISTFIVL